MAKISAQRFLELAELSTLVAAADVKKVAASLRDALSGDLPEDANQVADTMVEQGLLTPWQADMLLRGKHKGFHLGKYRLLGHLGTGGMSRIYLGEHMLMRRQVAIKVLPRRLVSDSSYLGRFRREAEAAAQLDHPNIVRAFDIDHEGDVHYFVMEYIEGQDFMQLVKEQGPVAPRLAADYVIQAADGLQHAHDAGLIHRDVKPGNCLVDGKGVVKLLDMGLAKFSEERGPSLTLMHDENVLGTADYLAPEQARNSHTVDSRADIYSLGCTLFFLLTGRPPFAEGTLSERLVKHQTEPPPDMREIREDVPQRLVDICEKMMSKSADKRYQTAKEVAQTLRDWMSSSHDDAPAKDAPPRAPVRPIAAPRPAPRTDAEESAELTLAPISGINLGGRSGAGRPATAGQQRAAQALSKARAAGAPPASAAPADDSPRVKKPAGKTAAARPPKPPPLAPTKEDHLSDDQAANSGELPASGLDELFGGEEFPEAHASPGLLQPLPSSDTSLWKTTPWWVWAGLAVGCVLLITLSILVLNR